MVKNYPLVSVVIPVFNMEKQIEKSCLSILGQKYKNIEIILIDDGSNDSSLEKCNKLKQSDDRVKVFTKKNEGSGPTRNFGISKSKGEYIYFPDADDFVHADGIQKLIEAFSHYQVDLVICGYNTINLNKAKCSIKKFKNSVLSGNELRDKYFFYKSFGTEYGMGGAPWNKLFKKEIITTNRIEFPPLRRHQDEAFIARYINYCNHVLFIEDVLYDYYENNQLSEWQKYPRNYVDSIFGLYNDRKQNVMNWNNDFNTINSAKIELVNNFIKAIELSFSPKHVMNYSLRIKWIIDQTYKLKCEHLGKISGFGLYHKLIYTLLTSNKQFCIHIIYLIIKFKVYVFNLLKR